MWKGLALSQAGNSITLLRLCISRPMVRRREVLDSLRTSRVPDLFRRLACMSIDAVE